MQNEKAGDDTNLSNNSVPVNMDVPAGIYFVVATAGQGRWCSKTVVN